MGVGTGGGLEVVLDSVEVQLCDTHSHRTT